MEDDSRRISVYDLTGLRVHPDGLRVHQTQENLRLGTHRRYNAQVPRGWIANDAGGSVITPKYRKHPQMPSSQDTGDSESLVKAGCEPGQSSEEMVSSTKGKRKDTSNIRKTLKRKKFAEDDSYISSSRMHKNSSGISQLPSQDLLKNIHYLAANFYDRNGLLINASKRYRKAKKLRKLRKSEVQINDGEVDDTEQIAVEDTFVERQRKVNRDMYRVLDGSVLVAIGIFTEEIVKKLLQGRKRIIHRQMEATSLDDEASD